MSSIRFRRVVLPLGPWVFGSVTLVFTSLPAHGAGPVGVLGVAFPGPLAAVSLAAGYAVQPWGRRLHIRAAAGGAGAPGVGLAFVTTGCLAAAGATAHPGLLAATAAALLLGAG